jgi:hypothetical protein
MSKELLQAPRVEAYHKSGGKYYSSILEKECWKRKTGIERHSPKVYHTRQLD